MDPRKPHKKSSLLATKGTALHAAKNVYGKKGEMVWKSGGLTFRMTAPPLVRPNGLLEVFVTADGLPLDDIDSFLFQNPPLHTIDETDEQIEDHETALKEIVEEAVLTAARVRGWNG
jgi:hypothetical protein